MQLRRSRSVLAVLMTVAITAMMVSCTSSMPTSTNPQAGVNAGTDGKPAPFREPVRLSSKDGVLEVRLSAHQGTVNLDTVTKPVTNFLVFGYDLIKGTSSDGSTKGDNKYPAPTLRVDPGERLLTTDQRDPPEDSGDRWFRPSGPGSTFPSDRRARRPPALTAPSTRRARRVSRPIEK